MTAFIALFIDITPLIFLYAIKYKDSGKASQRNWRVSVN